MLFMSSVYRKLVCTTAAFVVALSVIASAWTPTTDDFNRADESPLASPWVAPDGDTDGNFDLNLNTAKPHAGAHYSFMYNNAVLGDDQYAQVQLSTDGLTVPDGTNYAGACVRMAATGETAYCFTHVIGVYTILEFTGGTTPSTLATCSGTPAANDVVYISVVGTTITGKVNGGDPGGSPCNATDASIASGKAGMNGYGTITLDNFEADSLGGGGGGGSSCGRFPLLGVGCFFDRVTRGLFPTPIHPHLHVTEL